MRCTSSRLSIVALCLTVASVPLGAQDTHRPDVSGTSAAIVAGHPLAAAAGARVLREGGNAVDAAVTAAAVLAVVRPHMNGIGGDAFMLIRDGASGAVEALNGSGRAGSRATPDFFARRGLEEIPGRGVLAVSVPGAVRAWADALARHGTIGLDRALAPAIRYGRDGFPVSTTLAGDIASARERLARDPALAAVFLPGGEPPAVGTLFRQPDLARSLEAVAATDGDAFYHGEIARRIADFMEREDGLLTRDDLAAHTSTWQDPLETTYHGKRVLAFPPNTQGMALLVQLNMAETLELTELGLNSAPYIDRLVRIKELAFAERDRHVTDPDAMRVPVDRLISKAHAAELLRQLEGPAGRSTGRTGPAGHVGGTGQTAGPGETRAASAGPRRRDARDASEIRREREHDTVYLCVVDEQGNAVSLIESLFSSFGSARMVPGTGIILQNRGALFSLDPDHVNVVAPGKRTYHTLSPHMVLNGDGSLAFVLGTPGGDGQTQTVTQILNKMLLFGLTPQQAVEHPRWRSYSGRLALEPGLGGQVARTLGRWGHPVAVRQSSSSEFGGAQVIRVTDQGTLLTGADPRREAYGIAW